MQPNNQNQTQDDHDDQLLEEVTENLGKTLTLEEDEQDYDEIDDDDEDDDDDDEEFEFSFGGEEVKSPVSADEVFHNGKIRPTVPFYSGEAAAAEEPPPVKKVFVVSSTAENDNVVEGPYCVWATENISSSSNNNIQVITPEMSRKSNSTGFSRLRKMKDLLVRSNSDGKDTFVFLNGKASEKKVKKDKKKKSVDDVGVEASEKSVNKKKGKASMTAAYEALYGKKDKKSGGIGGGEKSYLPYRVGFFTNASGLSKNVHPY